jgi:3-isopropylmalate/(R)-2-methylmalate dehydratase small subunit
LEVDLEANLLTVSPSGKRFALPPIPPFMRELLDAGGLIPFVRNRLRHKERSATI